MGSVKISLVIFLFEGGGGREKHEEAEN